MRSDLLVAICLALVTPASYEHTDGYRVKLQAAHADEDLVTLVTPLSKQLEGHSS
jgi:hypothetical protein